MRYLTVFLGTPDADSSGMVGHSYKARMPLLWRLGPSSYGRVRRHPSGIGKRWATFRDQSSGWIDQGPVQGALRLYSARSVPSGSRVAARHAGRALAATPINSSRAPALKYVNGSLLLTP